MKPNYFRLFVQLLMGVTAVTFAIAYAFVCSYVYLEPTLPSVAAMKSNELAVPLRVYTRSGDLIAQIGEQRRNPVKYEQIPLIVRQAFIAAEDDRFFEHHGYDWQGVIRAVVRERHFRRTAGRQHHHHAGGAQRVLHAGTDRRGANCRKLSSPTGSNTNSPSRKSSRCIST